MHAGGGRRTDVALPVIAHSKPAGRPGAPSITALLASVARGQALRIAKCLNRTPPVICGLALVFGKPVRHGRRRSSAANGLQRDADFLRLFGQVVFRRG